MKSSKRVSKVDLVQLKKMRSPIHNTRMQTTKTGKKTARKKT